MIQNKYQFFGGTEQVVLNEIELLKKNGNEVKLIEFDNDSIKNYNFLQKLLFLFNCFYNFHPIRFIHKRFSLF